MIDNLLNQNKSKLKSNENGALIDALLSKDSQLPKLILGRNEITLSLINVLKIDAIIDDYFNETSWNGIKIIKSSDIKPNSIILNCSTSISPVSAHKMALRHTASVIGYHELNQHRLPDFVKKTKEDYEENKLNWENLYKNLADENSKKILIDLLSYRLTGNYQYMSNYSVRMKDQYFEDFMDYTHEVFVDAGGFIGDTSEEFIKRYPDYKHIYLFEPSSKNLTHAKNNLEKIYKEGKIDFIEYALSDKIEELSFDSNSGSSSAVSSESNSKIKATTLDEYVEKEVTFIKMDLEGWEFNALQGAKNHILKDHPKLAIAVYHSPSDFWKIFNYIKSLRSDYDVYLRHYTEGWSETIMYFKPIKNK